MNSIYKKQIIAITGLLLIGFVVAHLAGNLFIYGGPDAFNAYAKKLSSLRPALNIAEIILLLIFITHLFLTFLVVRDNRKACSRNREDVVKRQRSQTILAKLMPISGVIILVFILFHLYDFTFSDHHGPRNIMPNGQALGLYGVVYTSFLNPLHAGFYILAMISVGIHLAHGVQSVFQTFGIYHAKYTPFITKASLIFGLTVALLYSSIPIYINVKHILSGV